LGKRRNADSQEFSSSGLLLQARAGKLVFKKCFRILVAEVHSGAMILEKDAGH
jgi:hypothetical protein